MPPLLADFTHARVCKPFCEKFLTLPCKNPSFSLYNRENTRTWEIIKAASGKEDTDEIHIHFQPLSLHFFERMDS